VRFTLERSDDVALDVLDLAGRHVKVLARGTFSAGAHDRTWDGRSDSGEALRPGAYFVAGRIGGVRLAQRLILLR
jgi:flagellar hook assembly protein FlgD